MVGTKDSGSRVWGGGCCFLSSGGWRWLVIYVLKNALSGKKLPLCCVTQGTCHQVSHCDIFVEHVFFSLGRSVILSARPDIQVIPLHVVRLATMHDIRGSSRKAIPWMIDGVRRGFASAPLWADLPMVANVV